MRAFVAIHVDPTPAIRRLLSDLESLRGRGVRPVAPENLHMTLRFLGEIDEGRVPEITMAIRSAVMGHTTFGIGLRGLGTFPGRGRPRVLWIGVDQPEGALTALAEDIIAGLATVGFDAEDFTPHLTVARLKGGRAAGRIRWMIDGYGDTVFGVQQVSEVRLMRSILTPQGAIYDIVGRAVLGSAMDGGALEFDGPLDTGPDPSM